MSDKADPYADADQGTYELIDSKASDGLPAPVVNFEVHHKKNRSIRPHFDGTVNDGGRPGIKASNSNLGEVFNDNKKKMNRRVSLSGDEEFGLADMPSELENPLQSGMLPSPPIDLPSGFNLPLPNMGNGMIPTNFDDFPSIAPSNLMFENNNSILMANGGDENDNQFAISDLPQLQFPYPNSNMNQDTEINNLNSVSDMMLSVDSFPDQERILPEIPIQSSMESLPELMPQEFISSNNSSGNIMLLPANIAENPVNADGIPVRKCEICRRPIEYDGLFAFGNYYHKSCAQCSKCKQRIDTKKCAFIKDQLVCLKCAKRNGELDNCNVCYQTLDGTTKEIEIPEFETKIHNHCLTCYECNRSMVKGHVVFGNYILCKKCYNEVNEKKCCTCNEPIVGNCIHKFQRYYHPSHFTCHTCHVILKGNNYITHHNDVYCPQHGQKFLDRCQYCKQFLYLTNEDLTKWKGKIYHRACFKCRICGVELSPNMTKNYNGRPHCSICYSKRKAEEEENTKSRTHRHIPEEADDRRKRFKNGNYKVFEFPQYTPKSERNLEEAIITIEESVVEPQIELV